LGIEIIVDKEEFRGKVVNKAIELEKVHTLIQGRENKIMSVISAGIVVETTRSPRGELVPKSMFDSIFKALSSGKPISQQELLDDYNVHRSAFVMSLVSQLDDVIYNSTKKTIRFK